MHNSNPFTDNISPPTDLVLRDPCPWHCYRTVYSFAQNLAHIYVFLVEFELSLIIWSREYFKCFSRSAEYACKSSNMFDFVLKTCTNNWNLHIMQTQSTLFISQGQCAQRMKDADGKVFLGSKNVCQESVGCSIELPPPPPRIIKGAINCITRSAGNASTRKISYL